MFYFEPWYLIFISPALLLMMWAQFRIKSAYHKAMRIRAPLSGAAAAQHILQSSGIFDVRIEPTRGFLSDHYDPRHKVLRLSPDVYQGQSADICASLHQLSAPRYMTSNCQEWEIRHALGS